jgi:ABC-type branched-subunit amino acid transport system substrate-binding protein
MTKYPTSSYDAVYFAGSTEEPLILKQTQAAGMHLTFFSSSGQLLNGAAQQVGGKALNGTSSSLNYPGMAKNGAKYLTPLGKQFLAKWLKAGEPQIQSWIGAHAYEATHLLSLAVAKAKSTKSADLITAIRKIGPVKGYDGNYSFLPDQHITGPQQFIFQYGDSSSGTGPLNVAASVPASAITSSS